MHVTLKYNRQVQPKKCTTVTKQKVIEVEDGKRKVYNRNKTESNRGVEWLKCTIVTKQSNRDGECKRSRIKDMTRGGR